MFFFAVIFVIYCNQTIKVNKIKYATARKNETLNMVSYTYMCVRFYLIILTKLKKKSKQKQNKSITFVAVPASVDFSLFRYSLEYFNTLFTSKREKKEFSSPIFLFIFHKCNSQLAIRSILFFANFSFSISHIKTHLLN